MRQFYPGVDLPGTGPPADDPNVFVGPLQPPDPTRLRVLDAAQTSKLLARHPEIRADSIPSSGIHLVDDFEGQGDKDYLVGLVHATGEVKVVDITAYSQYWYGPLRIDPASPGIDWDAWWKNAGKPIGDLASALGFAALVVASIWLYNRIK